MASSMVSSASAPRAIVARATVAAPFGGLRAASAFPVSRKVQKSSNVGRIKCMKVFERCHILLTKKRVFGFNTISGETHVFKPRGMEFFVHLQLHELGYECRGWVRV